MFKIWNLFQDSLRGVDSSRQLALGVCLGAIIGIMPKDSLLCYLFILILILTTANLLCGIISAFSFSMVATSFDPWSHKIGQYFLELPVLETTWSWLAVLPVLPWTRFNNTVVLGNLVIGILAAIPLYYISYYLFETFGRPIAKRVSQNPMVGWLIGTPSPSPQQSLSR